MAVVQPNPETTPSPPDVLRGPSQGRRLWSGASILFHSRIATVGFFMVMFWVVIGLVSLVWTPYPPNESRFVQNLPPNATNWLGTDNLGRDTLSRLMVGTQVVLLKTRISVGDRTIWLPLGVAIWGCLLYTSDAADERSRVDLGGRRIITQKKTTGIQTHEQEENKR